MHGIEHIESTTKVVLLLIEETAGIVSPGGSCARRGVNVGYFSPSYHQRGAALADIQREREIKPP